MELLQVFREMMEHNYWARDRQFRACTGLSDKQIAHPLGGSFPSLHDTFVHLLAVEWLWLERWRGKSPKTLIPPAELPTLAAVEKRWHEIEIETRAYLATLDEGKLATPMTYVSTRGQVWTYPLFESIIHFLNHQNYHRGQVTDKLRMLGIEPPSVDYLMGKDTKFKL